MPTLRDAVDRIHYENRRDYTRRQGDIAYLDGRPLSRPFEMPRVQRTIALVIVAIGIVIGAILVYRLVIAQWQASADAEQAIAANLAREASIESVPQVASLIALDDAAIKASFSAAGLQIYDASALDGASGSGGMSLYKVPADMPVDQAAALYRQGVGSLSVQDATRLLNGSWSFSANREGTTSMVVRYADFSTDEPVVAVQEAIEKEGFDIANITESGVDESGNTYTSGTVSGAGAGASYTWKVSALPLDDVYSISGLPDACYVGIRVTAA